MILLSKLLHMICLCVLSVDSLIVDCCSIFFFFLWFQNTSSSFTCGNSMCSRLKFLYFQINFSLCVCQVPMECHQFTINSHLYFAIWSLQSMRKRKFKSAKILVTGTIVINSQKRHFPTYNPVRKTNFHSVF